MSHLAIFFRLNVVLDGKSHRPKVVCDKKLYRRNDFRRNVVHPAKAPMFYHADSKRSDQTGAKADLRFRWLDTDVHILQGASHSAKKRPT